MNRIDRLTAILIHLQSQRIVKAQDIADRFEISLRTVYRDVKALEEAGVPLIGEAGVGYSLVEGYRLPPVMFTREEATAFLTAEKLVARLADSALSKDYQSAMYKIKAVLKSGEKEYLENIDSSIEVLKSQRQLQSRSDLNLLPLIFQSISEKRVLNMQYFAHYRQENSNRCVEPIGVFYSEGYWHLIAFCQMRGAIRDFRIDRISELKLTDSKYTSIHPSLQDYLKREKREHELHEVVLKVTQRAYKHLDDEKYYQGFVYERKEGDQVIMTFFTPWLEGMARWYMMFGDEAQILSPLSLHSIVERLLAGVRKNMPQTEPAELNNQS